MLAAGMNVAMGLDEKSVNDDEDVFMEMRMIYFLHRHADISLTRCPALTPARVLDMATRKGAGPPALKTRSGPWKWAKRPTPSWWT